MKRVLVSTLVALLAVLCASASVFALAGNIAATKHNLSAGNPNSANVNSDESEICVFCHTPHNARIKAPLWNRDASASGTTYTLYTKSTSSTIDGTSDTLTPDSSNISMLCLSCHDGTISLGAIVNNYGDTDPVMSGAHVATTGVVGALTSSSALLGNDLSNDHPVAITYNTTPGDLNSVDAAGKVGACQLYKTETTGEWKVECASCHAVHGKPTGGGDPFLRKDNAGSALCLECHQK